METLSIGCRLPNGYILEVGLSTTVKVGNGLATRIDKDPAKYRRYELLGTNAEFRHTKVRVVATHNPQPYINTGVPKDLWDEWNRQHPRAWVITSGNLFVVKDEASAKAAALDLMSTPAPLAPIDPGKPIKVGGETVERRTDKD